MNNLNRFLRFLCHTVDAVFDRFCHGPGERFVIFMIFYNPEQISGIAYNKTVHFPFALHNLHDCRMQNHRNAVHRVVRRHHRLRAAFLEGRLEGFQIILAHIARIYAGRSYSTVNFIVITQEMLERCYRFQILGVVALNTLHQCSAETACQYGVLAISLFRSAPARVALHIYCRRPKSQAVNCRIFLVKSSGFIPDRLTDLLQQLRVPGAGQSARLRKGGGCAQPGNAVCPFRTMLIAAYS
ncbi:hypothetical protein D3C73_641570 [compost metagenome]